VKRRYDLFLDALTEPVDDTDHVLGRDDASVTVVEYGAYLCPNCGRFHHLVPQLMEAFDGDMRFVYRHFIREGDPFDPSRRAAEAAEAAGAQGRFWDMHDRLIIFQHHLEDEDLLDHARATGLDVDRFWADLRSNAHVPTVRRVTRGGKASGVTETPTLFINGDRYDGRYDFDSVLAAVADVRRAMRDKATSVKQEVTW